MAAGGVYVDLLEVLQQRAGRDFQFGCHVGVGGCGRDDGAAVVHGVASGGEERVDRPAEGLAIAYLVDDVGGHPVDREHRGSIVGRSNAAELDDGGARLDLELFGHRLVCRHGSQAQDAAPAADPGRLEIGRVAEVSIERIAQQRPSRHVRPGALATDEVALLDQAAGGFPDRGPTHREAPGEQVLVGQLGARRILTRDNTAAVIMARIVTLSSTVAMR